MLNPASLTLGCLESTSLTIDEKDLLFSRGPAGVTLFSRNIEDKEALDSLPLVREIQGCLKGTTHPFLVALDQEGGLVARLKHPRVDIGKAFELCGGGADPQSLSSLEKVAYEQGLGLLEVGINVNFAPVVDITFPKEDFDRCFINSRSFGATKEEVILRAGAYLKGLRKSGVGSCLKHFPGIGRIAGDTHLISVREDLSQEMIWKENLEPFRELHPLAPMVMVAHVVFPKLCSREATRSPFWITEVLRKELHYEGLILCDDLTMKAVPQEDAAWKDFVIETVLAGCDLLLICSDFGKWQMACDVLELEARNSPAFKRLVEASSARLQKFRQKL